MISDDNRIAFVERFVVAAQQIAATTKDMEAGVFWQHLQRSAFIVAPRRAQGTLVEMDVLRIVDRQHFKQDYPRLPIVALYAQDTLLSEPIKGLWESDTSAAIHQSQNNTIWLKTNRREADFIAGCQLLHEAGHSYRAVTEGRLGQLDPEKITPHLLLEEGDMHHLEARLWKEHGGSAYTDVLDKAVYWLQKRLRGLPGFLEMEWNEQSLNVLDGLFGRTVNMKERQHRMGSFSIYAHFEMIERSSWPNKRQHRANIIKATYKAINHRV